MLTQVSFTYFCRILGVAAAVTRSTIKKYQCYKTREKKIKLEIGQKREIRQKGVKNLLGKYACRGGGVNIMDKLCILSVII